MEQNMAYDRVLKVKCLVIHMYQEKGINLGDKHWERN